MDRKAERDTKLTIGSQFYCKSKKRKLPLMECLERYVDSNAFEKKRTACWRCFQGRKNRSEFSLG